MKRKRVQWSKEPDEAPDFSDWKITLAKKGKPNQSSQTVEKGTSSLAVTFYVHRNLLGTQSEYFNRIFKLSNSVAVFSSNDGLASKHCIRQVSVSKYGRYTYPKL